MEIDITGITKEPNYRLPAHPLQSLQTLLSYDYS